MNRSTLVPNAVATRQLIAGFIALILFLQPLTALRIKANEFPRWPKTTSNSNHAAADREITSETVTPQSNTFGVPGWLAEEKAGRLKMIFYAPTAPAGKQKDNYLEIKKGLLVAASLGGGRCSASVCDGQRASTSRSSGLITSTAGRIVRHRWACTFTIIFCRTRVMMILAGQSGRS